MKPRTYHRVELWIAGSDDADRMPDVNVRVLSRTPARALTAAAARAQRAVPERIVIEDSKVFSDGVSLLTCSSGDVCQCHGEEPKEGDVVFAYPTSGFAWSFLCARGFAFGACFDVYPARVRRAR